MKLSEDSLLVELRSALAELQKKYSSLYGWRVSITQSRSLQSLLLGDQTEGLRTYQERDVNDRSYRVTLYTRTGEPVVMGSSSKNIDPLSPLLPQLEIAYNTALLIENPQWDLPSPSDTPYPEVETADPKIVADIDKAHHELLQSAAEKTKTVEGVQVNSAELYTDCETNYLETSTGIKAEKTISKIYFEYALEKLPLPNTQEVLKSHKSVSLANANLPQFIDECVEETLSIGDAELPKTDTNPTVMVDGYTLMSFLDTLSEQLDGEMEYQKRPHLKQGELIYVDEKGEGSDSITMTLDPFIPQMANSTPFTLEGVPAQKALVIENDQVQCQIISSRMSDYLKKPLTPIEGNMIVSLGSKTKQELLEAEEDCIKIVSFSSLLLNSSTLTWSSEIKLARQYRNGKLIKVLKGGVISGNLKENFRNFRLSSESVEHNACADSFDSAKGYKGPNAMVIRSGVKIAGE